MTILKSKSFWNNTISNECWKIHTTNSLSKKSLLFWAFSKCLIRINQSREILWYKFTTMISFEYFIDIFVTWRFDFFFVFLWKAELNVYYIFSRSRKQSWFSCSQSFIRCNLSIYSKTRSESRRWRKRKICTSSERKKRRQRYSSKKKNRNEWFKKNSIHTSFKYVVLCTFRIEVCFLFRLTFFLRRLCQML